MVTPLNNADLGIKEYIKKATQLYRQTEELGFASLYLEGIIFDPEANKLLCAVEIDNAGCELTEGYEIYVYPKGKYQRKAIQCNSLNTSFENVITEIENKKGSALPIGAFSIWQEHHKLNVTAVDLIYGA